MVTRHKKTKRTINIEDSLYYQLPEKKKSAWLRTAIQEKLDGKHQDIAASLQQLTDQQRGLIAELHRIGNNLNQLTHRANMDKAVTLILDGKDEYTRCVKAMAQNSTIILQLLRH